MSNEVAVQGATLSQKMEYAQALSKSALLPASYKNNPANLLFALEYADALGIAPIHAITSIHVISGKPSASADLIAASVRKAGHKLRVTGDDTYAEAVLIRADDPDFEFRARWDMDKAKRANLNTATWKAYPAAMLRSRAITEVCRAGASDSLYGVVYTPEELGAVVDQDGKPVEQPQRPTGSRIQQAMQAAQEPEPAPMEDLGEQPDLVGEAIHEYAGNETALRSLYAEYQKLGAPQEVLDRIRAAAA